MNSCGTIESINLLMGVGEGSGKSFYVYRIKLDGFYEEIAVRFLQIYRFTNLQKGNHIYIQSTDFEYLEEWENKFDFVGVSGKMDEEIEMLRKVACRLLHGVRNMDYNMLQSAHEEALKWADQFENKKEIEDEQ